MGRYVYKKFNLQTKENDPDAYDFSKVKALKKLVPVQKIKSLYQAHLHLEEHDYSSKILSIGSEKL